MKDNDNRSMITGDGVGTTSDNRDVHNVVTIDTFNIDKTVWRAGNDTAVRASKSTICTTVDESTSVFDGSFSVGHGIGATKVNAPVTCAVGSNVIRAR
jgi:hypothetical protein